MGSFIINWLCPLGIVWNHCIRFMESEIEELNAELKRYKEVVFGLSMVVGALTTLILGCALLTYYAYYHLS